MIYGDDLIASTRENDIHSILFRNCSICRYWIRFLIHEGELYIDTSCECAKSSPKVYGWGKAANLINDMKDEQLRLELEYKFGLR